MRRPWIAFLPYLAVSTVHVVALALDADAVAAPTKLALMPLLALAAVWIAGGAAWSAAHQVLIAALAVSWIGDGAGVLVPWAPTLPAMLLFFGLAHACYIGLFWRMLAVRRVPPWALVYAAWWGALLAVLWPHLGVLLLPVAAYGLVLAGTAIAASRCHPLIAWGGAFFLASDSVLAFRLFLADTMPDWTSPVVMLNYTLGQGLLAAGVLIAAREKEHIEMGAAP